MRRLLTLLTVLAALWAHAEKPADYTEALDMCSREMAGDISGIWTFTPDGIDVLVAPTPGGAYTYDVFVLFDPSGRIEPGYRLAALQTGDGHAFGVKLYTSPLKQKPVDCLGRFNDRRDAITIQRPATHWKVRPWALLPGLFHIVSNTSTHPGDAAPAGLVRKYPAADTSPLHIRYL